MIEPLTVSLAANVLSAAGSAGAERLYDRGMEGKIGDILGRDSHAETVGNLGEEFEDALEQRVTDTLRNIDISHEGPDRLSNLSTVISEEFDEDEIALKDEQEVIVHVTQAIGDSLSLDIENNPKLREDIEIAVTNAYRDAISSFSHKVAGTEFADALQTEAGIEITTAVDRLDDRLAEIQRQLRRQRHAELRNEGFVRIDPLFFDRREPRDPISAWRTGFDLVEVKEGYALDRQRETEDDERRSVAGEILSRLETGENIVVLGEGGTGKSTVCKAVACRWHEQDKGPVLYRKSATTTAFENPGVLIRAVRAAEGSPLIVVEDAVDEAASGIYDVLDEVKHDTDVALLLDARKTAWDEAGEIVDVASVDRLRDLVAPVLMPDLDTTECTRAVEHFQAVTGDPVGLDAERLFEEVRRSDIGGPLILAYRLTAQASGGGTSSDESLSALEQDVRSAYREFESWAGDDRLPKAVGVSINLLNAARLPVNRALVHGLADTREDHRQIDRTLDYLEGMMVIADDADDFRTPHDSWSMLYLERFLDDLGERRATDLFEYSVNAVFGVIDDENEREQIRDWLRRTPSIFERIEERPRSTADWFAKRIFGVGRDRPSLAPLFGTHQTSRIVLPETCSNRARILCMYRRSRLLRDFDTGQSDLENEPTREEDTGAADAELDTEADDEDEGIQEDAVESNAQRTDLGKGQVRGTLGSTDVEIVHGDIAAQRADALVSSADTRLEMSGGVAAALERAAGDSYAQDVKKLGPLSVGEAVVTDAHELDADYVIHAAVIEPGSRATRESVRKATRSALVTADEYGCESIVVPLLGCGFGGLSVQESAPVILDEILKYDRKHLQEIRVNTYSRSSFETLKRVASDLYGP